MTEEQHRAERDAQIAKALETGDAAQAGRLRAEQLIEYRDRPRAVPDAAKIAELRQKADAAATMGNFAESARLRAEWLRSIP